MFAAAYGFPPSACRDEDEAMGLFANIKLAMAMQSATFARGISVVLSADANAELMKDIGASTKDIVRMKMEAMRSKSQGNRQGSHAGRNW